MTLLAVQHLDVRFPTGSGDVHASRDVSFSLDSGEVLGLVGETGSGKSVIGQAVIRLLPSSAQVSGDIVFQGQNLYSLSEHLMHALRGGSISLVPQNPSGSLDPLTRNGDQISEIFSGLGIAKPDAWNKVLEILTAVGLIPAPEVGNKYPHQLSGGMRQRLTTGIAITQSPRLIIADEPTKGLDYRARETTANVLSGIQSTHNASLLLITHDLFLAEQLCQRIAVMYAGEIVEIGVASQMFHKPRHPYTRALIQAIPKNGMIPLAGQSPSLMNLPSGCAFSERCPHCSDECRQTHPELREDCSQGGVRCHYPFSN